MFWDLIFSHWCKENLQIKVQELPAITAESVPAGAAVVKTERKSKSLLKKKKHSAVSEGKRSVSENQKGVGVTQGCVCFSWK